MIILKSGINKEKTPDIIGPINLNGNKIILIKRFSSSSFFLNAPFTYFSMFSNVTSYPLALILSSTVLASGIEIHNNM